MNPLAFGAFFAAEAGVKCMERVCVVSVVIGMGGSWGPLGGPPGPCAGACANTVFTPGCTLNKTTKAIRGNNDLRFLFMVDCCLLIKCALKFHLVIPLLPSTVLSVGGLSPEDASVTFMLKLGTNLGHYSIGRHQFDDPFTLINVQVV
jgi:hypothetical protein